MARVKAPLMSEAAVGTLGGLTFRNNGYGPCVSRRPISPHLMTPLQTTHRCNLKLAHTAWETLDPGLQAAWNAYAAPPKTGRNEFIAAYLRLRRHNLFPTNSPAQPPQEPGIEDLAIMSAIKSPPFLVLTWHNLGSSDCPVSIFALSTWSHRAAAHQPKLYLGSTSRQGYEGGIAPLRCWAPTVHLRLDILDHDTGIHLRSYYLSAQPSWT